MHRGRAEPTGGTLTLAGSGSVTKSRDEAAFAMKSVRVCFEE